MSGGVLVDAGELAGARLHRLREQLAEAPFDVLVCCGSENVHYATGYQSSPGSHRRAQRMAAIVTADDYRLVGPAAESAPAVDAGVPAERYVPYGVFYFESIDGSHPESRMSGVHATLGDAIDAALAELGADGAVGLDEVDAAAEVRSVVHDAAERVLPASAFLHRVRSVKLPGEVALIELAAQLAEDGVAAALDAFEVGMTERELGTIVSTRMAAGGGMPKFVTVTAGLRSAISDAYASDYPIGAGDIIRFDVGCWLRGYSSDIGRSAVAVEPTALQRSRYAALLAGEEREILACAPGVTAGELFDLAVAEVERRGIAPYRRQHTGHGIGMEGYEHFSVAPGNAHVLEPGNTLCVETPFYQLGWGGLMVEDTLLVTEDGCRMLTRTSRELRVVG